MQTTWQKIKTWTRLIVLGLVGLYVIAFFIANHNASVDPAIDFIFKNWIKPNLLLVLILDSVFSIFGWWLFRTVFRTLRQITHAGAASRTAKLEREVADMRAKAAMLQTRVDPNITATTTVTGPPDPPAV